MTTKAPTKGIIETIKDAKTSDEVRGLITTLNSYRNASDSTVRKAKRVAAERIEQLTRFA